MTHAESIVHTLDLTTLSGRGEFSQRLNILLQAASALNREEIQMFFLPPEFPVSFILFSNM